jgi:hypothetical protein
VNRECSVLAEQSALWLMTFHRILYPEMRWSKSHPMERELGYRFRSRIAYYKKHGPDGVGFTFQPMPY